MVLTPEEKHANKRNKMIEDSKELGVAKYCKTKVAGIFQKMTRAEAGAKPAGLSPAVIDGEVTYVHREVGQCVCISCGFVGPWKGKAIGGGLFDSGHFLSGRTLSILFEESGVNPQCKHCNKEGSGARDDYATWMVHVHGKEEVTRLRRLKNETISFTREEAIDMKMGYQARLNAAINSMKEG